MIIIHYSLHLIFVLQIYITVESLEEEEDLLELIFTFFNETPTLHFVLKKSSCNQGQLVTFQSHFRYFRYS